MAASAELMQHMSIFAEQARVKMLLQEYMRRVVLRKPQDPIAYLINDISKNPFVPPEPQAPVDLRSLDERERCVDARPLQRKLDLLRHIFDGFADASGRMNRGKFLAALDQNPSLLLEAFPRHARAIPRCLEALPATRDGLVTWDAFSDAALHCLAAPGS